MDLFPNNAYPHKIPVISDIEDIMIYFTYVVMCVYTLKGNSQVGYKGNCLILEQDIDKKYV